jgi:hypothetical protein
MESILYQNNSHDNRQNKICMRGNFRNKLCIVPTAQ